MSKKIDDYINGIEEVESEKVINCANEGETDAKGQNGINYYTEKCENHKKTKNGSKRRSRKNKTFAVMLATALITAIIVSSAFVAASPLIMPALEEFWGIEESEKIIYIESTGEDSVFDENENTQEETKEDNTDDENDNIMHIVIDIEDDDQSITKIAKVASPSVVGIKASYDFFSYFFGEQTTNSQGSGIILSSDGYIITNYHVIQDVLSQSSKNPKVEVYLMGETDVSHVAEIIGYEAASDLAVLKIDAEGLLPAQIGDSDELQVGELAVAIGNPGGIGLMGSVTTGVISGLNRQLQIAGIEGIYFIQTDAAINPGNSGGALLNAKGQVIGINEAKITAAGYEGLGFAIPINYAMEAYERILENRTEDKNLTIGVSIDEQYTKEFADSRSLPYGLLVSEVIPTSGAYVAGIKVNDIITKINGVAVTTIEEFNEEKNKYEAGDIIEIEIYRYRISEGTGEYITVEVELMSDFDYE